MAARQVTFRSREARLWWQIGELMELTESVDGGLCVEAESSLATELYYGRFANWYRVPERNLALLHRMEARVDSFRKKDALGFVYPEGRYWKARAMAAYWLALDAEANRDFPR